MMSGRERSAEEIVVVRRRGGAEDDHHHGGVWKIAYADFMTAMMAFFLVMWLINASNTETKASVASYFNPIKLTDTVSRRKGLLDIDQKANAADEPKKKSAEPAGKVSSSIGGSKSSPNDSGNDGPRGNRPSASVSNGKDSPPPDAVAADNSPETASRAGTAFRDPFNPLTSAELVVRQQSAETRLAQSEPGGRREADFALAAAVNEIRQQLASAERQSGVSGGPAIDVTIEDEAIVLSLTDTATFGMFSVGSSELNAETVRLIQSITPAVAGNGGRIIVRGHTDSRPFRGDRGNNWRLSMARADAVHTLLVRSGIEETRFERVEAHADRKPKIAHDPEAAANRRIEILIRMRGK